MFCFRRATVRLLSSKPSASKSLPLIRPFTSVVSPTSHLIAPKTSLLSIQRRFASEITQSEPEADGATEAQHGDNSIATASQVSDVGPVTSEEESAASLFKEDEASASKDQSTPQEGRGAISEAAASVAGTAGAVGEMLGRPARSIGGLDSRGSRIEPEPSKTVYVGNLFFDVRAEDLEQHFESAGPIISAKIINDARGLSKGFGYIEFENVDSASRAIELFNQENYEGRRLSVQFSASRKRPAYPDSADTPRMKNPPSKTLFIGNMSFDMSDRDLNNLFREIKNVVDVRVAIDRRTGQPRGFAHADFTNTAAAEKANEELNGKVVCGRALRVDYSTSQGDTGRATIGDAAQE